MILLLFKTNIENIFKMSFLGIYSYGTLISKPENRATKLIIFDGFDILASVSGSLLSPIILNNLGEYANFGIKCGCTFLALLYAIFIIKEPSNNTKDEKKCQLKMCQIVLVF